MSVRLIYLGELFIIFELLTMFMKHKRDDMEKQLRRIGEAESNIKKMNSDLTHIVGEFPPEKKAKGLQSKKTEA